MLPLFGLEIIIEQLQSKVIRKGWSGNHETYGDGKQMPRMQDPLLKSFYSEIRFDALLLVMSQDWTGHER